jgi:hydroxymethylbilane synthase
VKGPSHPPHAPVPGHASASPRNRLPLRVGTRASRLALVQTRIFLRRIATFCPVLHDMQAFQEHAMHTTGDLVQDRKLADIGGKGLFAKEIHEALADHRIDFAVHSLKDLETTLPTGIVLACTMTREDSRDALLPAPGLVLDPADPVASLPRGARIGTSSVRREAILRHLRPDLAIVPLRGNIDTRMAKLEAGGFDAILLAMAGLKRIGADQRPCLPLDPATFVPAACQGIVGITCRAADDDLRRLLAAIEDPASRAVALAERALLAALDGSCRTPIGGHARLAGGRLALAAVVARTDGSFHLARDAEGPADQAEAIGTALGTRLRAEAPADLFAA